MSFFSRYDFHYSNSEIPSTIVTSTYNGVITITNSMLFVATYDASSSAYCVCNSGLNAVDVNNTYIQGIIEYKVTSLSSNTGLMFMFMFTSSATPPGRGYGGGQPVFRQYIYKSGATVVERWYYNTIAGSLCYYDSVVNTWGTAATNVRTGLSTNTEYYLSVTLDPVNNLISVTNSVQATTTATAYLPITNPLWWTNGDFSSSAYFAEAYFLSLNIRDVTQRRTFSNYNALTTTKTKYRNPIGGSALTEKIGFSTTSYGRLTGASRILGTTPTVKKLRERTKT